MANLLYYRIAGNGVALSVHAANAAIMLTALQDELMMRDPQIKNMASMQSCYLTIWNIAFQIAYAGLALSCDVITVFNKEHLLPKPVKKIRDGLFSSAVFPITMVIFIVFWPLFIFDRSLIFPEFIDKVFSFKSNCVMHLAIIPFVLWELAFQPRTEPKSHALNVAVLMAYYSFYNIHIHLTYYERGLWPYPLMYQLYGSIFYIILQALIVGLLVYMYFVQWPIYTLMWGKAEKINGKRQ